MTTLLALDFKKIIFFVPMPNIFLNGWHRKQPATRVAAMKVAAPKLQRQKVLFPYEPKNIKFSSGLVVVPWTSTGTCQFQHVQFTFIKIF